MKRTAAHGNCWTLMTGKGVIFSVEASAAKQPQEAS